MNVTRWNDFTQLTFIKPRIWSWTMRNKLIILLADCLQRYDKIHDICTVITCSWSISILTGKTRRYKRSEDLGDQEHRKNHTMHLASKSERSSSSNYECKQLNEIQNWLPNFINRENITWPGKSANYNLISLPKAHKLHLAPLIDETTITITTTTRYAINRPEYAATGSS
jgi:hypothetical protein